MNNQLCIAALLSLSLLACSAAEEEGDEIPADVRQLTVAKVNEMLAASDFHGPQFSMSCDGSPLGGCFESTSCKRSSDFFSTRMVYSLEQGKLEVFLVSYDNDSCSGEPGMHPTSRSEWNLSLTNLNTDVGTADLTARLVHYSDGFTLDSNKPVEDVDYRAFLWVDSSGNQKRLCLSTPLIDPARPVKFMSTTALALDSANCAVELPLQ